MRIHVIFPRYTSPDADSIISSVGCGGHDEIREAMACLRNVSTLHLVEAWRDPFWGPSRYNVDTGVYVNDRLLLVGGTANQGHQLISDLFEHADAKGATNYGKPRVCSITDEKKETNSRHIFKRALTRKEMLEKQSCRHPCHADSPNCS